MFRTLLLLKEVHTHQGRNPPPTFLLTTTDKTINRHSNFTLGKSQPIGQMAFLLDMPACYFKDSVMKREIRLGVYRQDQGRTKKVPIDFFNINQRQHRKQHL